MTLKINSIAPDFKAKSQEGDISFHEWLGDSWGVLFSHPKDFTPVCTTELGALAKMKPEFDKRNVKVIGLSVDPVSDHIKWLEDIKDVTGNKPNYPIIADERLEVAKLYNMLEDDAGVESMGRTAVDNLTVATSVVMTAVEVAGIAAEADTKPEQVELQGMLETDAYSLDAAETNEYNEAVAAVEQFAQQAGAFMAAANNDELTSTVDSYAAQGNFMVGSYTAITYTQSVDEFVIAWGDSGFGTGFQGYLTPEMKGVSEIYAAGEYINEYGGYPTQ